MNYGNTTYLKPFALCVWLFLFLNASARSQPHREIASVRIIGNGHFSQQELISRMGLIPGTEVTDALLDGAKTDFKEIYGSIGFYDAHIDTIVIDRTADSNAVQLSFFISEGAQTVIHAITFSGNSALSASRLLSMMESTIGDPLDEALFEADVRSILDSYSNDGLPFAKIVSDSISIDSAGVHLVLVVVEGPRVFVDEMQIEGNSTTHTNVITREARLGRLDPFRQEKLDRIKKRLERMQLFSSVSEPQIYIAKAAAPDSLIGGLSVVVKEGSANTFDGILGYVPSSAQNTDGYFTGDVFVAFRNLFGTGRKADIKWKRENELTQELELYYREPWLFGIPLSVSGLLYQRKQDSSFVKTKVEVRAEYAITEELTVAAHGVHESVYPAADLAQFSVFESSIMSAGGEIVYDTRDNVLSPTAGVRYSTTVRQGVKEITGPQKYLYLASEKEYSLRRYSLDAEGYIPTFSRQVIMVGVHGRQVTASRLELSDLYPFGGTTTLRGYRENQFFASKTAWVNVEYRFLTGRASSLYGCIDGGYYYRPADAAKLTAAQEQSLYGYGFGIRLETGLGILNVNYALGEGDSFSNGKIHVGIINEF